ncbi:MAG: OmpA family protein [Rhodospirillaceae bacterium]|nr:OmpA family protein [Rhodospirillaceae bacterium]
MTLNAPIIIKKKKKGHGHGHHGGAWKVAYADFVTAMMAFFLLLWLLNVTTDEQRRGIADYFDPASASRTTSGSGGVLGGLTVGTPGHMSSPSSEFSLEHAVPGRAEPVPDSHTIASGAVDEPTDDPSETDDPVTAEVPDPDVDPDADLEETAEAAAEYLSSFAQAPAGERAEAIEALREELGEQQFRQVMAQMEHEQFTEATEEIRAALRANSGLDLDEFDNNLVIEEIPDGLRIQILDRDQTAMFESGSAEMMGHTRELMRVVAQAIAPLSNDISISGHTDSQPFRNGSTYDNWDLSVDRANASRRTLVDFGIPPDRIANVVGLADTQPMYPEDTADPRNRRISIVLLSNAVSAAASPRL